MSSDYRLRDPNGKVIGEPDIPVVDPGIKWRDSPDSKNPRLCRNGRSHRKMELKQAYLCTSAGEQAEYRVYQCPICGASSAGPYFKLFASRSHQEK